jgi:hypothetical protein
LWVFLDLRSLFGFFGGVPLTLGKRIRILQHLHKTLPFNSSSEIAIENNKGENFKLLMFLCHWFLIIIDSNDNG